MRLRSSSWASHARSSGDVLRAGTRWRARCIATREPSPQSRIASRFGPVVLEDLERLPDGTLGRSFALHCRARALNPNLVQIPPTDEVGSILHHMYQTHDIWHVVTGWGNDLPGEIGLGGFYSRPAQESCVLRLSVRADPAQRRLAARRPRAGARGLEPGLSDGPAEPAALWVKNWNQTLGAVAPRRAARISKSRMRA